MPVPKFVLDYGLERHYHSAEVEDPSRRKFLRNFMLLATGMAAMIRAFSRGGYEDLPFAEQSLVQLAGIIGAESPSRQGLFYAFLEQFINHQSYLGYVNPKLRYLSDGQTYGIEPELLAEHNGRAQTNLSWVDSGGSLSDHLTILATPHLDKDRFNGKTELYYTYNSNNQANSTGPLSPADIAAALDLYKTYGAHSKVEYALRFQQNFLFLVEAGEHGHQNPTGYLIKEFTSLRTTSQQGNTFHPNNAGMVSQTELWQIGDQSNSGYIRFEVNSIDKNPTLDHRLPLNLVSVLDAATYSNQYSLSWAAAGFLATKLNVTQK